MIHRRHGKFRASYSPSREAHSFKRLGARNFVNQVQINVDEGRLSFLLMYYVIVPYLLEKGLRGHEVTLASTSPDQQSGLRGQ